ncbi:hypothetical protein [Teichococcus vastitatis]|uniref:Uncharacterized protein n=1 Tax=Teichococcus vastitatis TaxID=2307076 RepID=A0ABS9W2I8_9PROT|nr:hypothetical protein [Pseudoroseomonas vastitatis]MCI0753511.1 hypothetical protein [Pseudoroseomonas vastitatis]
MNDYILLTTLPLGILLAFAIGWQWGRTSGYFLAKAEMASLAGRAGWEVPPSS